MTTDRTDELIRGMLQRRAGREPPADLGERTLGAIAAAGQDRSASRLAAAGRPPRSWSAIVIVVGLIVLAGLGGLAIGRALQAPDGATPTQPATVVVPSGDPTPGASTPPASLQPSPTTPAPSASPSPYEPTFQPIAVAPRTIAEVTPEGFHLRVRSAPRVADDSALLEPVLEAGQRMLVLNGPVSASGLVWWEVLTYGEVRLYGWVADGKGEEAWIAPVDLGCAGAPAATQVVLLSPEEFLACFGDQRVTVDTRYRAVSSGADACAERFDVASCAFGTGNGWLEFPTLDVTVDDAGDRSRTIALADLDVAIGVPWSGTMRMGIALDAPEARECRVADAGTGVDLLPPGQAVAECRVTYVLREAGG